MEQRISTTKLILGVFFTLLGVVMTLDNLDVLVASHYLRWWPLVLIVIGATKIDQRATRAPAIVCIVLGMVLLLVSTVRISLFDLWPLILIFAGGLIVAQSTGLRGVGGDNWLGVLSVRKVEITDPTFAGGNAVAFLGGCEVDLRKADMAQSPAIIDVFALMGGIEIKVPDGWEVLSDAVPFMGGVEVKTRNQRSGRQLLVRGLVMMGGLEVKA